MKRILDAGWNFIALLGVDLEMGLLERISFPIHGSMRVVVRPSGTQLALILQ
jgi:hypothetical protein